MGSLEASGRVLGPSWKRLGSLLGYLGRLGSVIASPGAVEGAGKEAGGAMPAGGRLTVGNACLACRSAGFGPRPFGATCYPIFLGFPKLPSHETEQRAISFQGEARRRARGRSTLSNSSNRKVISGPFRRGHPQNSGLQDAVLEVLQLVSRETSWELCAPRCPDLR